MTGYTSQHSCFFVRILVLITTSTIQSTTVEGISKDLMCLYAPTPGLGAFTPLRLQPRTPLPQLMPVIAKVTTVCTHHDMVAASPQSLGFVLAALVLRSLLASHKG